MRTPEQFIDAAQAVGEEIAKKVRRGSEVARRGAGIVRRAGSVLREASQLYEEGIRARAARAAVVRAGRRNPG